MGIDFYQLRIKYITKDGSIFVDYTTVGAKNKDELSRAMAYHRRTHAIKASSEVEILVKALTD